MKITSSAFQQGGNIPSKFTCDGGDTSPPLQMQDIPAAAKSLVLIVDDPDAPSGLFTHWIGWNISPQTTSIAEAYWFAHTQTRDAWTHELDLRPSVETW